MAKHVEFWDHEAGEEVTSKREYDKYSLTAILAGEDNYYSSDKGVTLHLWVDDSTGIVVNDISKYEASL